MTLMRIECWLTWLRSFEKLKRGILSKIRFGPFPTIQPGPNAIANGIFLGDKFS